MNQLDIQRIKNMVCGLLKFTYPVDFTVYQSDDLRVDGRDGKYSIGCADLSMLARGVFLLCKAIDEGTVEVHILQKRYFTECGVMVQLSFGNALKVEALKRYIDHIAALGFNLLMLYMEDLFELEGYPYFGYMRGRYSAQELKEIDDYAYSMGVELVPCVQTLAHLENYTKWKEAAPIHDSGDVLLVNNDETYVFIRAMLSFLSSVFRTRKIHIGMDEANGMGFGNYYASHGLPNRKQLLIDHILRVKELCGEYGLVPRIWSDMLFEVSGGTLAEYSPDAVITNDIAKAVEDVELVYWNYYRTNREPYDYNLDRHFSFSDKVSFAGGVWTWDGLLVNTTFTIESALPGLRSALEHGVQHILATSWGKDAEEMQSFYALAAFSEFAYRGNACTPEMIHDIGSYLTKVSKEVIEAMSDLQLGYDGAVCMGRRFLYCDVLYPLFRREVDHKHARDIYNRAIETIERDNTTGYTQFRQFAICIFKICILKSELLENLRLNYQAKNYPYLNHFADEVLPELIALYEELSALHEDIWLADYKPFGIEKLHLEYGGIIARLHYVRRQLSSYLDGRLERISELEEAENVPENTNMLPNKYYMSTRL